MPLLLLALVLAAVAVPVRWQSLEEADGSALPAADSGNGAWDAADALFDSDGESDLAVLDDADESSVAMMEGPFDPLPSCNNVAPICPHHYEPKPVGFNSLTPKVFCGLIDDLVGVTAGPPFTCSSSQRPNQQWAVRQEAVCDPPPQALPPK